MSARQTFALCIDCWEMHYGIADKNGVYSRDSGSSNHWDHAVHVFGAPNDYPPPIRAALVDLHAGVPISDGRMELFSLGCAIHALQPNNGVKVPAGWLPGYPAPVKAVQDRVEERKAALAGEAGEVTGEATLFDGAGETL